MAQPNIPPISPNAGRPRASHRAPSEREKTAKSFAFDHVYDEFCTQAEVYSQFVAPFTAQFLGGYNVTLFACTLLAAKHRK